MGVIHFWNFLLCTDLFLTYVFSVCIVIHLSRDIGTTLDQGFASSIKIKLFYRL